MDDDDRVRLMGFVKRALAPERDGDAADEQHELGISTERSMAAAKPAWKLAPSAGADQVVAAPLATNDGAGAPCV